MIKTYVKLDVSMVFGKMTGGGTYCPIQMIESEGPQCRIQMMK